MIYHTRIVRRGTSRALVVCDLPFLSYQISREEAIRNAGRAMAETGCHAVKLEGGKPMAQTVRARSEEHTSELQSPYDLVCRLLLEKKKKKKNKYSTHSSQTP